MEPDPPKGEQRPHRPTRPANTPETEAAEIGQEPRGIEKGIADADKKVRTGKTEERVRDTPPAGAWNDTSSD